NVHNYFAALRELDRVVHEIDDNLPQSGRVADQPIRDVGGHAERQVQPFFLSAHRQCPQQIAETVPETKVRGFQRELASLQVGEIQDVVDDRKQSAGG